MRHDAFPEGITGDGLIEWYRSIRYRTRALFDIIEPEAYYARPISLRNPIVFYEGHLPAFSVNTLVKRALGRNGVDDNLEILFERGIDPADVAAVANATNRWPERGAVQEYGRAADALIEDALLHADLERDDVPTLRGGEAVFTILEHELMHQETLLYMLHALPYEKKVGGRRSAVGSGESPTADVVMIPAGRATLGLRRGEQFGWDNEFPEQVVEVPAFTIDVHNVTNGAYLEYMNATGAPAPHFWALGENGQWERRAMFEQEPLPLDAPVYVTHDEAAAFARWKGKRLPTEAEFHRAAYGTPSGEERSQPWGDAVPDSTRGNFDFAHWDPVAVGSYPAGASAWGVHDLVGNGWEWTSTLFGGFPGFTPMPSYPEYSADFFDEAHYVLKGASPVTPRELIRRSFRNWFRPNYPYVFATFRCVS
jgi:formylglycine-generating enzyme required for sulfatase activity